MLSVDTAGKTQVFLEFRGNVSRVTAEPLVSSVTIEKGAPEDQPSAITSLFARYGMDVEVMATQGGGSPGMLPWLVEIEIVGPIAAFFASFGAAFGPSEGNDAYPLVTEWLQKLVRLRERSGEGTIEIRDEDGTSLILSSRIAREALDALALVEWETAKGDSLRWDQGAHRWHGVLEP